MGTTIDRPIVVEGRLPDADAPDEIMINELAQRLDGYQVGDVVEVSTFSREDLDALENTEAFSGFHGPPLTLTVVGVGRQPRELPEEITRNGPGALASPALLAAHPELGAWPPVAAVTVTDPATVLPAVAQAAAEITNSAVATGDQNFQGNETAADTYGTSTQRAVDGLAVGLLVFAVVAALAGGLVVAQTVSRQLQGATEDATVARALGLTRGARAVALAAPVVAAVAVGRRRGGPARAGRLAVAALRGRPAGRDRSRSVVRPAGHHRGRRAHGRRRGGVGAVARRSGGRPRPPPTGTAGG